ncbi:MAG: amidohydrolase family protein, partial [Candidatus Heimdallarchaeota archaeon]
MNTKIEFVLTNGLFVTMDKNKPRTEAIAINDGKIIAVGTVDEIEKKYKHYKKKIDLKGKFVCPGFNDAHTHLLIMSAKFLDVMLDKVTSANEALEKISERVQKSPKGKWIFGERWDESNWDEKRYITLDELDKIAPENPCFIRRVCGHLASLNTLALKELEIP